MKYTYYMATAGMSHNFLIDNVISDHGKLKLLFYQKKR